MTRPVSRFVAVDWSGARDERAQRAHIWVAVVEDGTLVELSAGRTREETVEHLLAAPGRSPLGSEGARDQVVGLDFSFGFPEWFARAHGCVDGPAAWALAAATVRAGCACPPPFFGPRGTRRPPGTELFRWTELEVRANFGLHPKSVFQLAGPGAVGVGSLRGMPLLAALRARGFAVWPFDPPGPRTVVELYPALAVRGSAGSSATGSSAAGVAQPDGRRRFLDVHRPGLTSAWPAAVQSRDAFDAVVAAFLLADHASFPESAGDGALGRRQVEGEMWLPPLSPGTGTESGPDP